MFRGHDSLQIHPRLLMTHRQFSSVVYARKLISGTLASHHRSVTLGRTRFNSFRSRDFIIDQHASGLGNEKKSPCRLWLIDGCKSSFNVKPSTVPTRLIHELYAHTRTTRPERFLGAETPWRPNIPQHLPGPCTQYARSHISRLFLWWRLLSAFESCRLRLCA